MRLLFVVVLALPLVAQLPVPPNMPPMPVDMQATMLAGRDHAAAMKMVEEWVSKEPSNLGARMFYARSLQQVAERAPDAAARTQAAAKAREQLEFVLNVRPEHLGALRLMAKVLLPQPWGGAPFPPAQELSAAYQQADAWMARAQRIAPTSSALILERVQMQARYFQMRSMGAPPQDREALRGEARVAADRAEAEILRVQRDDPANPEVYMALQALNGLQSIAASTVQQRMEVLNRSAEMRNRYYEMAGGGLPYFPVLTSANANPAPQGPIRVGGNVQDAKKSFAPAPVYPEAAKRAGVSGMVRLSALLDADGKVINLQVVSGHPLLTQAALDAVRKWTYQPTLLNGTAVQVATTIDVDFTLAEDKPAQR